MPTLLLFLALILLVLIVVCAIVATHDSQLAKAAWRRAHPTLEDKQHLLQQTFETTDMSTDAYEAALDQLLNSKEKTRVRR